jgi:tetratricopeptide (TPR) repeat protein
MESYLSHEEVQDAGVLEGLPVSESVGVRSIRDGFRGKIGAAVFSVAMAVTGLSGCKKVPVDECLALNDGGKSEEAVACYDRVLGILPDDVNFLNKKGFLLYTQGDMEGAVKCFDRALELKPDYAEALHNKGLVFAEQGQFDEAIGYYNRALKLKPDRAYVVCFHKCLALQKLGHRGAVIDCYDQMLDLDPDDNYSSMAWNNKGKVASDMGVMEQAVFC